MNSPNSTLFYTTAYTSTPLTRLSCRLAHSDFRTSRRNTNMRSYNLCLPHGGHRTGDRVELAGVEGSRLSWQQFERRSGPPEVHESVTHGVGRCGEKRKWYLRL